MKVAKVDEDDMKVAKVDEGDSLKHWYLQGNLWDY